MKCYLFHVQKVRWRRETLLQARTQSNFSLFFLSSWQKFTWTKSPWTFFSLSPCHVNFLINTVSERSKSQFVIQNKKIFATIYGYLKASTTRKCKKVFIISLGISHTIIFDNLSIIDRCNIAERHCRRLNATNM